ncbi:MAG: hypothetical protein GY765_18805 [bacterium]|nr:hypothetical protein [bacterium]
MGFDDLLGNKRIKNILTSYLKHNIVPHSVIFTGPGSTDLLNYALAFAKTLNCLENPHDFCGTCRNCTEATQYNFPDLYILEADGQFYKKEQITFLVEDNFKKPMKGKKKVYILTDAHRMNANSANAFLKVLEEPALSNVFILLTENMEALLPTIKSRCQILKFSPLSRKEIKEFFIEKGDDQETANLKSYLSRSTTESLLTSDFDQYMQKRSEILGVLTSLLQNRGSEAILVDLFKRSRSREKFVEYFRQMVNLLELMLRDIMVLSIDPQSEIIINVDYRNELVTLGKYIGIERILVLIRKMELVLRDVKRNLNTKVLIREFIKSYTDTEEEAYNV